MTKILKTFTDNSSKAEYHIMEKNGHVCCLCPTFRFSSKLEGEKSCPHLTAYKAELAA